jgi:Na+/proline symporter
VVRGFGAAFWKAGYALPFIVPLVVLLATRGKTRRALLPVGVATALIGFFWFTYLHGEPDPTQWIGWSAARVFSPLTFLFALAALCSRPSTRDERRAPSLS